jgi:hypothetical protein
MKQRIALVAVSALTAGVLSVASTPVANAVQVTAGNAAENNMLVSGSICGATNLVGTTPLATDGSTTDTTPFETTATGKVITVPVGGLLTVEAHSSDIVTISGPLSIQDVTGDTVGLTNGKVTVQDTGANANSEFTLSASGAGSATLVTGATADITPTAANTIRVTIVATCASTGVVAATSFISVEDTSIQAADNVDTSASQADAEQGYLSIVAKNAYGTVVPSGTWIASATNGARVDIADTGAAAATSTGPSSDAVAALGTDVRVAVAQATEGVAMTSVVTVTYNGALVATKSFSWTGDLASITVTSIALGNTGAANYNSLTVRTFDAAGTQIDWAGTSLTLEGFDQNVTTGDVVDTKKVSSESSSTNDGHFFTCGSGAKSTTKLKVKGINGSLGVVYSPEFTVSCSTSTRTYTAALDKTSYVPGDIATLTITVKDINGNAPFDPTSTAADNTNDTFNYVNAGVAGTAQAIGYSNLTPVVAPAAGDFFLGGVKTYQFVVGATEGDYQLTLGIVGLTNDITKTVKYSIKSSTTTVSNADVLKSIVALIASINKQIQALQKLILARR